MGKYITPSYKTSRRRVKGEKKFNIIYRAALSKKSNCIEYPGASTRPTTWYNNRSTSMARASLSIRTLSDPKDMLACHSCNNELCINGSHLYWGTYSDNIRDAVVRDGKMVKLTYNQRLEIKISNLKAQELAIKYNISKVYVYKLRSGEKGLV